MTTKTINMLGQVRALADYLDEHAEDLNSSQTEMLQQGIDRCWEIACRRNRPRSS